MAKGSEVEAEGEERLRDRESREAVMAEQRGMP